MRIDMPLKYTNANPEDAASFAQAYGDEIQGMFIGSVLEKVRHRRVVERSDNHRVKPESGGLKKHVLRRMSRFHVNIANAALAVFSGSAFMNRCEHQYGSAVCYP